MINLSLPPTTCIIRRLIHNGEDTEGGEGEEGKVYTSSKQPMTMTPGPDNTPIQKAPGTGSPAPKA